MVFLFPRWDMLISWRVTFISYWHPGRETSLKDPSVDTSSRPDLMMQCPGILLAQSYGSRPLWFGPMLVFTWQAKEERTSTTRG